MQGEERRETSGRLKESVAAPEGHLCQQRRASKQVGPWGSLGKQVHMDETKAMEGEASAGVVTRHSGTVSGVGTQKSRRT